MPRVPIVSLDIWKELYSAADLFQGARPWETFDDTDIIGVYDSETGETSYGVCMGQAGMLFGLVLYRGVRGYDAYRRMAEGLVTDEMEFAAVQDCVKLELGARSDLEKEDLAVIKKLFLTYRGDNAWPQFRSMEPGYAPWFLTEREAMHLSEALIAVVSHFDGVHNGEIPRFAPPGMCFVYEPVPGDEDTFLARMEPIPASLPENDAPVTVDPARIAAIRAASPRPDTPWEVDSWFHLTPVDDAPRPYFPRLGVVCQQQSGMVYGIDMKPPDRSPQEVMTLAICTVIQNRGLLPSVIYVRTALLASALAPLAQALGISILQRAGLPAIDEFKNHLRGGFAGGVPPIVN